MRQLPRGSRRVDVRDADALAPLLAGVDVVCHQAAVVGAGVERRRRAGLRQSQRLRHGGAAGADVRRRGVGGWCWRRRWWCTARAATTARSTGRSNRCRGGAPTSTPGASSTAARSAGRSWPGGWSARTRRCGPRSLYAASKTAQEHYALAWAEATGGSVVALRYHNVYGPGMPRDTPYSGVAAIFRSALEKGEPPKVFEDGGQMRDFVHVDDVAAANVAAVERRRAAASSPSTSARGGRSRSWRWRPRSARRAAAAWPPVVTGQYRSGDVRHIVADPARAGSRCSWASVAAV